MPESPASPASGRSTAAPGCTKRILIAADETMLREALAHPLRDEGYVVVEAADGREAVERALGEQPDLIVMDVMMPVLDGRQALSLIRSAQSRSAATPVVMMSAAVRPEALDASIAGYLPKPFDIEHLLRLVAAIIGCPPSSGLGL